MSFPRELRTSTGTERKLRRVLVTLCLTEITSWGVLYYAFPVLSIRISEDTGWSQPAITAAFSSGLVVSALVGVGVGRWLDRHGPRGVMTAGSVLSVLALLGIAAAPNIGCFLGGWLVAGVAMGGVLYPPAFAALTRWYGPSGVGALTVLTLVAGLASTIFAPLTAALAQHLDWRGTYLVLAAMLGGLTVPAHLVGLDLTWPSVEPHHQPEAPTRTARSRAFVALVVALALAACASYAVIVNLIPLLVERGISAGIGAVVIALGGAGQVIGRLGYGALSRRVSVRNRTVIVLAAVAGTTALLGVFSSLLLLIVVATVAGMIRGILTLVQATSITERWGADHYGHLSGILSAPVTVSAAVAPWVGAAVATAVGGYAPMFFLMGCVAAAAAVIGLASIPPLDGPAGGRASARSVNDPSDNHQPKEWLHEPNA